jgi:Fur family transcriptional regulator, ferric uptake regulator
MPPPPPPPPPSHHLDPLPPSDEVDAQSVLGIVEPLCAIFRRKLKAEGLKYTPERARILDAIVRMDGLFEAEELLAAVRTGGFRVSKATVYRTIRLLQDAGIIQRIPVGDEQSHFQLVYGRRPNDLLIRADLLEGDRDDASGDSREPRIETLDLPELIELRDRICRERGLEARGHRFQIFAVRKQ